MFCDGLRRECSKVRCVLVKCTYIIVSRALANVSAHERMLKSEFITNTRTNGVYTREFTTRKCQVKFELYHSYAQLAPILTSFKFFKLHMSSLHNLIV